MLYYTNSEGTVVAENEKYISISGKTYPARYPKSEISELTPVKLVAKPSIEENEKIIGFEVNDKKEQVWKVEEKSSEELDRDLNDIKDFKRSELLSEYLNAKEDSLKSHLNGVDLNKGSGDLTAIATDIVMLHKKYKELKESLDNAASLSEVKSIVW